MTSGPVDLNDSRNCWLDRLINYSHDQNAGRRHATATQSTWFCGNAIPDAREDVRDRRRLLGRDQRRRKSVQGDGKTLRIRDTLVLESPNWEELYTIQEKKVRVRDTMEIEQGGKTIATIKKALVSPLRDRYSIEVEGGDDLEAKGNIVDHEYKIERDGDTVAEVSKRWFRVRDTYGIEVAEEQNDALIVAAAVCIDQMGRGE